MTRPGYSAEEKIEESRNRVRAGMNNARGKGGASSDVLQAIEDLQEQVDALITLLKFRQSV